MTPNQKERLSYKMRSVLQPKEIKPYEDKIRRLVSSEALTTKDASNMIHCVYEIHYLDLNWREDEEGTKRADLARLLVGILNNYS